MSLYNEDRLTFALRDYLKINARVYKQLTNISKIVYVTSSRSQIIIEFIEKSTCSIIVFKWLILIHKLFCDRSCPDKILLQFLSRICNQPISDFDKLLTVKLINPYMVYLQKRLLINMQMISENMGEFITINLMNRMLSFVDILYTLGRYYAHQYGFIVDFNIILGIDLKELYNKFFRQIGKNNRQSMQVQVQKLHEKMYVVYYNCYFYKFLKSHAPIWINTDDMNIKNSNQKSLDKTNTSLSNSRQTKELQRKYKMMTQSLVLQAGLNQEQQERLSMIKSLERIVQMID